MQPKSILLPEIDGEKITFVSIYKNQFNSWNLRDQVILNPEEIDHISLQRITKLKIYNQQPIEGHFLIKIQSTKNNSTKNINNNQKDDVDVHLYAVSQESHKIFFQKLLIYKFLSMNLDFDPTETFKNQIEDDIMKKSEFLGNWEERHVKITAQEGLTSKKIQKQKQSLHIKQTKQIWTRFELLNHDQYVVVKVKYLLGKQQFGVPTRTCGKWIRAFYSLFAIE